jgi:hypothetical protein
VAKTIPVLEVDGWSDIWRVYTHPRQGIIEIRTRIGYGAQLDSATGEILAVYARGGDFWEDLHEGILGRHRLEGKKIFGDIKADLSMWLFLPVNIIALFLWFSGVVVALRTSVRKTAPAQIPAIANGISALATAVGGTASGAAIPLLMPTTGLSDADGRTLSAQLRHENALGEGDRGDEARAPAERRRAAARRGSRRRADIGEGSDRTPVQTPAGQGTWQARTRAAWRRRTG